MKYKTSELIGGYLDSAVAEAIGLTYYRIERVGHPMDRNQSAVCWIKGLEIQFAPSLSWQQGGPIVERERIRLCPDTDGWLADVVTDRRCDNKQTDFARGSTALIAGMRALVASKLGENVEL